MIHALTTRLEIDVMQETELRDAIELANAHRMPAVVVHPDLAIAANIQRIRSQATCAIITPVDWPKGDRYGMAKFRHLPIAALSQDGFEIMLSQPKTVGQIKTELATIVSFIKSQLPQTVQVRFVLDVFSRPEEYIKDVCSLLCEIPAPNLIRTDHNLKLQQSKANVNTHNQVLQLISGITPKPVKISGNVSISTIISCNASRYAVSLRQAQSIIKELQLHPEKTKKLSKTTDQTGVVSSSEDAES